MYGYSPPTRMGMDAQASPRSVPRQSPRRLVGGAPSQHESLMAQRSPGSTHDLRASTGGAAARSAVSQSMPNTSAGVQRQTSVERLLQSSLSHRPTRQSSTGNGAGPGGANPSPRVARQSSNGMATSSASRTASNDSQKGYTSSVRRTPSTGGMNTPGRAPMRSLSPPADQQTESLSRQLKEKEEQIAQYKQNLKQQTEQRRSEAQDRLQYENLYKQVTTAKAQLFSEIETIKVQNEDLNRELQYAGGSNGPGSLKMSEAEWNLKSDQLQKQLNEISNEGNREEEKWRQEIVVQQKRLEKLQQQHAVMMEEELLRDEELRKELDRVRQDRNLSDSVEDHFRTLNSQLDRSLERQAALADRLNKSIQAQQMTQEEWSKAEYEWDRRWEGFKDEKDQWTQEKEMNVAEYEKLQKVEQVLNQQVTTLQDKIDAMLRKEDELEKERRALRAQAAELELQLERGTEEGEIDLQRREKDLERNHSALHKEVVQLREEKQRLTSEVKEGELRAQQLQSSIEKLEERQRFFPDKKSNANSNRGNAGLGRNTAPSPAPSSRSSTGSARFSTRIKGQNCTVSFDGATATRTKGCRQCVVLGDTPLELHVGCGWYFELRINEVVTGWVGGLGIGITLTRPGSLPCLPDRAWRVPNSWIAGYWGRMFGNGQQHLIDWKPQELKASDRVGFLVNLKGECIVYVNDEVRVHFTESKVPVSPKGTELTALVDVFASAASVTLIDTLPPGITEP